MMIRHHIQFSIPLVLVVGLALAVNFSQGSTGGAEATPEINREYYQRSARIIAQGLPQAHLTHKKLNDAIGEKALNVLLTSLDHDKTFFLASDVEEFEREASTLDNQLRRGNTDFAYQVFDRFRERVENRVQYVNDLLDRGFDFTLDETYSLDREHSPWPADEQEWNELWRKKIKNAYLGRMIAKELRELDPPEEEEKDENTYIAPLKEPAEEISDQYTQLLNMTLGHDDEFILQTYFNAFTRAYDAHSAFMSPRANEDFAISMKLSLTGIGALLTVEDGAAQVVRLIKGGPAEQDGRLMPGDKIVAVAQGNEEFIDIVNWPLYKSVRLIRGEVGTEVKLTVIPATDKSGSTRKIINLVRDEIKLEDKEAKSKIKTIPLAEDTEQTQKIGVITLPEFYASMNRDQTSGEPSKSSAADIKKLLEEINEENVDGLILDLRNNGGGSLADAIEMTGYFIDSGPVVQVKANRRVEVKNDPNPGVVYDGPLVVLVNRQSASASEILSGALQDYGRAIIVGDSKTHGKGTVQSVFPLDRRQHELGMLKLTTAGFFRIDGRSTQLEGIKPDIVVPSAIDVLEVGEEYLKNVIPWSWVSSANYEPLRDNSRVIEYLKKRSEERLSADEQYVAYKKLIERLDEKIDMVYTPLEYTRRKEMALKDKEIQELQKDLQASLYPEDEDEDEENDHKDVILKEAIHILQDLVNNPLHS